MHLISKKGDDMAKDTTKAVQRSNQKTGKKRRSVNLLPEQDAQLERLKEQYGTLHAVFLAGMNALEGQNDLSKEAVLEWIKRNT